MATVKERFIEERGKIMKRRRFESPELLLTLSDRLLPQFVGEQYTPRSMAFELMDGLSERKDGEEIMNKFLRYSTILGIFPGQQYRGVKLQASDCLAQYLEKSWENSISKV